MQSFKNLYARDKAIYMSTIRREMRHWAPLKDRALVQGLNDEKIKALHDIRRLHHDWKPVGYETRMSLWPRLIKLVEASESPEEEALYVDIAVYYGLVDK